MLQPHSLTAVGDCRGFFLLCNSLFPFFPNHRVPPRLTGQLLKGSHCYSFPQLCHSFHFIQQLRVPQTGVIMFSYMGVSRGCVVALCVCVCVYEGPADSNTAGIGTSRPLPMSISLSVVCSAQKKAFVASALPVLYLHTEGAREREGEEIGGEPWLLCAWGAQHRDQPRCSHNAPAVTFGCMHPFKGDPFFSFLCICFILIAFC